MKRTKKLTRKQKKAIRLLENSKPKLASKSNQSKPLITLTEYLQNQTQKKFAKAKHRDEKRHKKEHHEHHDHNDHNHTH